ncbi:sensor domain-containing diguanylate cyclase [Paraburkholderia lacunae]|uniref:diguanylate cyclase n=1 Tax=Paraburkholderia lacunae TaxID=2211104 RepID=A0A370N368_9BURK|nr:sensor domain-containing diguanylate cyclase [Paraburkholderia lacunae]RDK00031.1 hypothetical protein DLM46_25335 [Paraburkholderia lacunae]
MRSLSAQPIARAHVVFACSLAALIIVTGLIVLPFANRPLRPQPLVFPITYTAVFLCSSLTAFLLLLQFGATRRRGMFVLSSAYVFLSTIALLQLLAMLGIAGLGAQPLPWLWVSFHAGFPLLIAIARFIPNRKERPARPATGVAMAIVTPLLITTGLGAALTYYAPHLPVLVINATLTAVFGNLLVALCVEALSILVVVLLAGLRDRLDLWLCVTVLVYLVDEMLVAATPTRYTVGWLSAAVIATLSSAILLFTLLWEVRQLYRSLITLNAELQEQAFHDGLTGMFSRRYFDQTLPLVLRDRIDARQPLCLMLIDVDHFKACNDLYGHPAGDRLLIRLARTLSQHFSRPGQFVARYGGEEFAAVLPRVDTARAADIAESLRQVIEESGTRRDDVSVPTLTVSIGVACVPASYEPVEPAALVTLADEALYAAKRAGRNCVRVHVPDSAPSVVWDRSDLSADMANR